MFKPTIYIYSASGAVRQLERFNLALSRLKKAGFQLEIDPAVLTQYDRFAGTDQQRLAAIYRAANSSAQIIMPTRGGYGLTRLLADLDFKRLETAISNKIWLGFSDFSVLQAAVFSQLKLITWAGYMLLADFGQPVEPDLDKYRQLEQLAKREQLIFSWQTSSKFEQKYHITGKLWGGNLAVLTELIGTPYLVPLENGILYFEDVAEQPYKIERMLLQWLYSGILAKQQAIVLGQFSDYKLTAEDNGFNLTKVIERLQRKLTIPIVTELPFGHSTRECVLPFGKSVELTIQAANSQLKV